jgi:hypothetical protein
MVAPIRQTVTVREDGRVEIVAPELRSGDVAEVIVMVRDHPTAGTASPLQVLDQLQKQVRLDRGVAEQWIDQVNEERRAI